ncbi:MAG: hypothetical protein O2805_01820 [Proteobacteria bacterium]|nr:hypothetical protein [Pseudomonadota bacterium]
MPGKVSGQRFGVGIDEQLRRVTTQALFRHAGSMHAIAITLASRASGQIAIPDAGARTLQVVSASLESATVEQAELDGLGDG